LDFQRAARSKRDVEMKRISLASLAGALPALSAAPHAATLGVSMALFDDNFLTAAATAEHCHANHQGLRSALSSQGGLERNS
jgi:hypothetical protein